LIENGGKGLGKKNKTGGRRKRDEMSSLSSENSQGMPELKRNEKHLTNGGHVRR